jgi:aconitate hydratase
MYLGIKAVIVKSFARIHMANLVNVGILPLILANPADYATFQQGDLLRLPNVRAELLGGQPVMIENVTRGLSVPTRVELSERQVQVLLAGGELNHIKLQTAEE